MGRFNRHNIVLLVAGGTLAVLLLAIMLRLDQPLRTAAAPRGIVFVRTRRVPRGRSGHHGILGA